MNISFAAEYTNQHFFCKLDQMSTGANTSGCVHICVWRPVMCVFLQHQSWLVEETTQECVAAWVDADYTHTDSKLWRMGKINNGCTHVWVYVRAGQDHRGASVWCSKDEHWHRHPGAIYVHIYTHTHIYVPWQSHRGLSFLILLFVQMTVLEDVSHWHPHPGPVHVNKHTSTNICVQWQRHQGLSFLNLSRFGCFDMSNGSDDCAEDFSFFNYGVATINRDLKLYVSWENIVSFIGLFCKRDL